LPKWSEVSSGKDLRACPTGVQWALMLVLSGLFVLLLDLLHLPASLLLGPMSAAIVIAAAEGSIRLPRWPLFAAQGVVGCLVARAITPAIIGAMLHDWPLFLVTSLGVIAAGAALGWGLARLRILPGTTAVWGSAPGAATVMVLMAEAHGADSRLVAFMQYLRVVFVAVAASVISRLWTVPSAGHAVERVWFPAIHWLALGETIVLAAFGLVGVVLRIPAGPLLLPMAVGAALHGSGIMEIELPPWLLAPCYAMVGWSIGLRFTRPILVHAARALPSVVVSILLLIGIGCIFAILLNQLWGVDPLTAYLATSPGGADSVAIIAASSKVDVPFVMAQQIARFVIVLFIGPSVARFVAGLTGVAEKHG
jgi:uncharacterized protein